MKNFTSALCLVCLMLAAVPLQPASAVYRGAFAETAPLAPASEAEANSRSELFDSPLPGAVTRLNNATFTYAFTNYLQDYALSLNLVPDQMECLGWEVGADRNREAIETGVIQPLQEKGFRYAAANSDFQSEYRPAYPLLPLNWNLRFFTLTKRTTGEVFPGFWLINPEGALVVVWARAKKLLVEKPEALVGKWRTLSVVGTSKYDPVGRGFVDSVATDLVQTCEFLPGNRFRVTTLRVTRNADHRIETRRTVAGTYTLSGSKITLQPKSGTLELRDNRVSGNNRRGPLHERDLRSEAKSFYLVRFRDAEGKKPLLRLGDAPTRLTVYERVP
ncbi:MAG: hypothetical protein OHK0029_18600 [Armatimonadaceae bacterium]